MNQKVILKLKTLLLNRKREILKQIAHLEMGRDAQKERVIELADAAQKEDLVRLIDHLVGRGNEKVREIDLALERIAAGKYGICEICEKRIEKRRLEAVPATRFCRKCAQNFEQVQELLQHPRDEIMDDALLDKYRNLLDRSILEGMAQLSIATD
jgi:RNA polymerase-binding transcription factor DksA